MKLSDRLLVSPDVVTRQVAGETALLDIASGAPFVLDAVSARIWQLIEEEKSLGEICDALAGEYDVSQPALEQDVRAFVAELLDKKLVSLR